MHLRTHRRTAHAALLAAAALAGIGVRSASADSIALTPTVSTGTQYFDTMFGMDFTTNQPITVTRLGVFDNNDDGTLVLDSPIHPIVIQIWDLSTGTALATMNFGDGYGTGTDTTVGSGQVFFQTLPTPLSLPAGGNYYISEDYAGAEGFANEHAPETYTPPTVDNSGAITFVGTGRASLVHQVVYNASGGSSFTTNGFIDQGPANRYTGPNFQFTASTASTSRTSSTWSPVNLGNIMPLGDSITFGIGSTYGPDYPVGGYRVPLYADLQGAGYKSTYVGSVTDGGDPLPLSQQNNEGLPGYVIETKDPNDPNPQGSGIPGVLDGIGDWLGPSGSNPQFILLQIGTNDVDKQYDPGTNESEIGARLATLISTISNKTSGLRPDAHLIVAQITPTEDANPALPDENQLIQEYNACVANDVAAAQAAGENVTMVDMYDAINPDTDLANNLHPNDAGYAKMAQVWLNAIEAIAPPPPPIHVLNNQILHFASDPANAYSSGIVVTTTPGITVDGGGEAIVNLAANQSGRQLFVPSGGLTLAGTNGNWTGLLDLTDNDMQLSAANSSLATITDQIRQGYNGGNWNGAGGIISSAAANDSTHLTALGVIQNDQGGSPLFIFTSSVTNLFDGILPAPDDILVKYTYYGDTNLDGVVDGSDYSRIDFAYLANQNSPGSYTGWFNGDFNYDGVIDGSDYTLMDNAFNTQGASLATAISTAQIAASNVPEPATFSIACIAAAGMLGRRKRSPGHFGDVVWAQLKQGTRRSSANRQSDRSQSITGLPQSVLR